MKLILELDLYDKDMLLREARIWEEEKHYNYNDSEAELIADYITRAESGMFCHSETPILEEL